MKKLFAFILSAALLAGVCCLGAGCGTQNDGPRPGDETGETPQDQKPDLAALKKKYGTFSIVTERGTDYVLSDDGKVCTISVGAEKGSYTLSGYFEGRIVINNKDGLATYKGVKLHLDNACIVSTLGTAIEYLPEKKNVEIVAKRETENHIINASDVGDAVVSHNNLEVDGKGTLHINSAAGHALNAEDTVRFYDATTVDIVAGHDGIHAAHFVTDNEEALAIDFEAFTGTVKILYAFSQGFDCTTSKSTGTIDISSGTFEIANCESAFKTDVTLTIAGTVRASKLTAEAVVHGDNSTGATISITGSGTFTVDGAPYTKTSV